MDGSRRRFRKEEEKTDEEAADPGPLPIEEDVEDDSDDSEEWEEAGAAVREGGASRPGFFLEPAPGLDAEDFTPRR